MVMTLTGYAKAYNYNAGDGWYEAQSESCYLRKATLYDEEKVATPFDTWSPAQFDQYEGKDITILSLSPGYVGTQAMDTQDPTNTYEVPFTGYLQITSPEQLYVQGTPVFVDVEFSANSSSKFEQTTFKLDIDLTELLVQAFQVGTIAYFRNTNVLKAVAFFYGIAKPYAPSAGICRITYTLSHVPGQGPNQHSDGFEAELTVKCSNMSWFNLISNPFSTRRQPLLQPPSQTEAAAPLSSPSRSSSWEDLRCAD